MAPDTLCQQVSEELLSRRPLTGALAAHLVTCPTCAQARQTLEGLKTLPSAWPAAPSAALQQRIMKSVADAGLLKPAIAAPTASSPGLPVQGPAGSLTLSSLGIALAGGAILVGLLICLSHSNPADRPGVSRPPAPVASASAAVPHIASGTVSSTAPVAASPTHQLISDPESDQR